jgi:hypothetical protein
VNQDVLHFGGQLLQLAFFAGMLYAGLKRMQKDLNGLGARSRESQIAIEFRSLTIALTTIVMTEDLKERQWLAEKFLDGWRRP